MFTRSVAWPLALTAALACLACQKLEVRPLGSGKLSAKPMGMDDAIPREYGDLVGVIPSQFPDSAVLLFQRADKSLVAVTVNLATGSLAEKIIEIPRR